MLTAPVIGVASIVLDKDGQRDIKLGYINLQEDSQVIANKVSNTIYEKINGDDVIKKRKRKCNERSKYAAQFKEKI